MKHSAVILVVLLHSVFVFGLTVSELFEDPDTFLENQTTSGIVYVVVNPQADLEQIQADGLPPLTSAYSKIQDAVQFAGSDETEKLPILMVDLRSASNPKFLRYDKTNGIGKWLKRIAKENGLRYDQREDMYKLLATRYQVDAVQNGDGKIIILSPNEFRILGVVFNLSQQIRNECQTALTSD